MSNDLISRRAVIRLIESKFVDGCLGTDDTTLIDAYELLDDVSKLPTAYDVDGVVRHLKEKMNKELLQVKDYDEKGDWEMAEIYSDRVMCYRDSMQIVNAGVVHG